MANSINDTHYTSLTGTSVIEGHIDSAVRFFLSEVPKYISIGKTSPWTYDPNIPYTNETTDDKHPPAADPSGNLLEVIGCKKIDSSFLVYPSEQGEIEYNGRRWKISNVENAKANNARYVYACVDLAASDLPTGMDYRQIALIEGLTLRDGVPAGRSSYVAGDIEEYGSIYALYNRDPVPRQPYQGERIQIIIQF